MKVTTKTAREMLEVLEELRKELFQNGKTEYPFAEWERKRELIRRRLRKLPEFVKTAAEMVERPKSGAGRPKGLNLVQRTMLSLREPHEQEQP